MPVRGGKRWSAAALLVACAWAWSGVHHARTLGPRTARRVSHRGLVLRAAAEAEADPPGKDIHAYGNDCKRRGLAYREELKGSGNPARKVVAATLMVANFVLFTIYRAWRGFFVILPAVFVEVRNKLETREPTSLEVDDDIDPKTGKVKLRSTILMNFFAGIFTLNIVIRSGIDAIAKRFKSRSTAPQ